MTWHVYDKMAAVPWALARATERTPYDRLRRATELFRRFPFRAPSYDMVDVGAAADVVAFDVRRCPVAEYFQAQGLRRSASTRGATSTCRWRRSGVRGSSARARSRRGQSSATSAGTSRGGSKPCCPRPARGDPAAAAARALDADPDKLQRDTFGYFVHETIAANGLVIDKTAEDWPASIAATGLALAAYPVGVERGFLSRSAAVERTLATLRFFCNSRQGPEPDATGYHGFYHHFLDMRTGHRVWQCELSTVDSAFLLAGALTAGMYFDAETPDEREIRDLGDALYRRADWQWAQNHGATVTHGWRPESGLLNYRCEGYDEAHGRSAEDSALAHASD